MGRISKYAVIGGTYADLKGPRQKESSFCAEIHPNMGLMMVYIYIYGISRSQLPIVEKMWSIELGDNLMVIFTPPRNCLGGIFGTESSRGWSPYPLARNVSCKETSDAKGGIGKPWVHV